MIFVVVIIIIIIETILIVIITTTIIFTLFADLARRSAGFVVQVCFLISYGHAIVQGGSNMTGRNCDLFTHNQFRSHLNHLVFGLCGNNILKICVL